MSRRDRDYNDTYTSSRHRSRDRHDYNDKYSDNNAIDYSRDRQPDHDRHKDRERDRDYGRSSHKHDYDNNNNNNHDRSHLPRSKQHRLPTFKSHWDELPDPNNPPKDPLQFILQHPNAPKLKHNINTDSNNNNTTTQQSNKPDNATRVARRLYLGNLISGITDGELRDVLNDLMKYYFPELHVSDCVSTTYINHEKKFAFIETNTVEEAASLLLLDQVLYKNQPIKIRRPADYDASMWPAVHASQPAHTVYTLQYKQQQEKQQQADQKKQQYEQRQSHKESQQQESNNANKLFIGGLPYNLGESEVHDLLSSFGELRHFHLVRDKETQTSRGYGFCEYAETNSTEEAINKLNGIQLGDRTLTIRKAISREQQTGSNINAAANTTPQQALTPAQLGAMAVIQAQIQQNKPATKILVLTNMFELHELDNDNDYNDIKQDIQDECSKYGNLLSVILPRAGQQGAGKVFLEYDNVQSAADARKAVEGRQFGDKIVLADYMSEDDFHNGNLMG